MRGSVVFIFSILFRLQELEDQYRKEREEASNLLEQQRLVSGTADCTDFPF